MSNRREPWTICGRKVGTATGWDQGDTWIMQLYNFQPGAGWRGPPATDCLTLDFERGLVQIWNEDGQPSVTVDLVTALSDCERDSSDTAPKETPDAP